MNIHSYEMEILFIDLFVCNRAMNNHTLNGYKKTQKKYGL